MNRSNGNRWTNLIPFMLLLTCVLVYSPKFRVYYQATPCEVGVARIDPSGDRQPIETPESFQGLQKSLKHTERRIMEFALTSYAESLGTLEWTLSYAEPYTNDMKDYIVLTGEKDE